MRYATIGTCVVTLILAATGRAATHTVPATLVGSVRDDGSHGGANFNYVAGDINGNTANRNYFLFDLAGLALAPDETIGGASVTLNTWQVITNDPAETVTFFDLSTPRATLAADTPEGSAVGLAIYADAGTGTVYGSQAYTPGDASGVKTIPLNAAAFAAIAARAGAGDFGFGGAVTTLDGVDNLEFVYGASNATSPPTLTITTTAVPEPLSVGVLLPLALLGRRRLAR
jgi:hypothetical protein